VKIQEALDSVIPDLRASLDIQRASMRRLSEDGSEIIVEAVWSEGPTELRAGLTYRLSVSSLKYDWAQHEWPVVSRNDPKGGLVEGILIDEGLQVRATIPVVTSSGGLALFLSVAARNPEALEGTDLSALKRASANLSDLLDRR
jgi:hypothetical protein